MAQLPDRPTMSDLQCYMDEVCQERGWTKGTCVEKFMLFADRKTHGLYCKTRQGSTA